ncbi:MAG: redoxin domain-containing protein [Pirellulales bacterium]|nr:redoxin domain-containing protein [Pirellulales bacterium]
MQLRCSSRAVLLLTYLALAGFIAGRQGSSALADVSQVVVSRPDREVQEVVKQDSEPQHPFPNAESAPNLEGGVAWLNTAGPLDLRMLRGKFVILDFWTYCCINCIHELPQLKQLEEAYPNELVVIGVHSAKFDTEQNTENIKEAILRYEIKHPVVNDAAHRIWDRYGIASWPSLRVIDPEGNLVAGESGEVPFEMLNAFMQKAMPYYESRGLLDKTPLRFELEEYAADRTPLRFPGKVLADEASGRLFIADSNHNRIVMTTLAGELLATIGSGEIGADDGDFANAQFDHPQGMALHGDTLYVADTENHTIRKVDLDAKTVSTIAGTGEQGRSPWPGYVRGGALPERFIGDPKTTAIASPWDLVLHDNALYIAMAGPHQIWKMTLDEREIGPYAGNGREDIIDGARLPEIPYAEYNTRDDAPERIAVSAFAQPSGLATDGTWIYVADSEGSSVRAVPLDPQLPVRTVVGTAHLPFGRLFEFGDVDGKGKAIRMQHCLGVAHREGKLYVADTYNNKVKEFNLESQTMRTLAGDGQPGTSDAPAQFDEPAGISLAGDQLFVADTNNHLIRMIDLDASEAVSTLQISGLEPPAKRPVPVNLFANAQVQDVPEVVVKPGDGHITVRVKIQLPPSWKINPQAPLVWQMGAEAAQGAIDRSGFGEVKTIENPSQQFEIKLAVDPSVSLSDVVRLAVNFYYCQPGNEGLCKAGIAAWRVPLKIDENAEISVVELETKVEE